MRAFHNNPAIQFQHLARLRAQHTAGEIVQNQFDCSNNLQYELELGIPWNVAWLQDDIFETLPEDFAPAFVLRFLEVISVALNRHVFCLFNRPKGVAKIPRLTHERKFDHFWSNRSE
jgi:hypothetical protein